MRQKNCLLRGGSAHMLSQALHSDSEGGGEDELDHSPTTTQTSQMLDNDLKFDDLLSDIPEISMPLEALLFPAIDIDLSESGQVGSHNEDGIVHEIEVDNNPLHQFKTEDWIFTPDQNSGPALLTASGASSNADVKVHTTTAVNGEELPSALIQVDAQVVEYKPVNSGKSLKKNLQKKTKSSDSASTAAIGTPRKEGARKRVLKRPAVKLQQRAVTNKSRKNSVKKVKTKKPKKICSMTADAPNLNAAKARENRLKKKQETIKLQSENDRIKKMHEALQLRNEELYTEVQNQKKMNAAFFGLQRVYPSVIGPIETVLKSLKEENGSAGAGGGKQWEIRTPPWFSGISASNVNNIEVLLQSMGFALDENILSASKYFTLHFNPFDRIIQIDYNPQVPNVSAHVTPPV